MKKIVILGNSPAGVQIIEGVRQSDSSGEITLVAFDGHYPYQRDTFAMFISKSIPSENVFCRAKDFYVKNKVNVLLDKKISRVNVKRKKIFFEDNGQIDYDVLIITDTPENRFPPIKGATKTGIFGYKKLKDIDQILNILPLVDTVAIQSDSFSGLQVAAAFAQRGKEVIFIASQDSFLTAHFEDDVLRWLVSRIESAGLRVVLNNSIAEILGEKDARAVRIKTGKVFSVQIILFIETDEDLRLFSGSELQMNKKINVDTQFRSSVESIFVLDQVCSSSVNALIVNEPVTPLSVLLNQGKIVAAALNGQDLNIEIPPLRWDLKLKDLAITVLGQTAFNTEKTVHKVLGQDSGRYIGLYFAHNCLVGAILVNAEDKTNGILRMIQEKTPSDQIAESHLDENSHSHVGNRGEIHSEDISTELVDN